MARNDAAPAPAVFFKTAPAPLTLNKEEKRFGGHFHRKIQESYIFQKHIFVVKLCFS